MGEVILTEENSPPVENERAVIERQRRFLLRQLPEPLTRASRHVQIWDNYITNTRLRLRKIRVPETRKYILKLTQKFALHPSDLSRAVTTDTYLSPAEYKVLSIFEGNEIRKNRYPFEHEGRAYSIDVFLGALWGLVMAEISFESDEELRAFAPPPFAFVEVTDDETFAGGTLVNLSFEEIKKRVTSDK